LLVPTYAGYRRAIGHAYERISTGGVIMQTRCGPIEYAVLGEGPPLLSVHGAGGGFDQGLDLAESLARSGFRVIAVSRFGYLRTPLWRGRELANRRLPEGMGQILKPNPASSLNNQSGSAKAISSSPGGASILE
jgi:pimeloyl-ACP methyl ester carboxylesterase